MASNSTTTLRGATVAAISIVVVLMSSMGKMAAEGTSCTQSSCIAGCPSKCQAEAESTCSYLKHGGSHYCPSSCLTGCKSNCESACNGGSPKCPPGGVQACDPYCRNEECEKYCYDQEKPEYHPCLDAVSQRCKNDCEAACNGGKTGN